MHIQRLVEHLLLPVDRTGPCCAGRAIVASEAATSSQSDDSRVPWREKHASRSCASKKGAQVVQFNDWCVSANAAVGNHGLCLLTGEPAKRATGIEATAAVVPGHYAAEEQVSRALARLVSRLQRCWSRASFQPLRGFGPAIWVKSTPRNGSMHTAAATSHRSSDCAGRIIAT